MNEQATKPDQGGQPINQTKSEVKTAKKSGSSLMDFLRKVEVKLLRLYYGNPAKDLKIVIVTGSEGANTVAHFVHETLKLADAKTGLVLNATTPAKFYRKLSKIWRDGANHAVVTAPLTAINNSVFLDIPAHSIIVTNSKDSDHSRETISKLLKSEPNFLILNRDDVNFDIFNRFGAKTSSISYGKDSSSDIRINRIKVYKKGTEVNLNCNGQFIDFATFVTGEEAGPLMAAAATNGFAMSYSPDNIIDGIASYEPKETKSEETQKPETKIEEVKD